MSTSGYLASNAATVIPAMPPPLKCLGEILALSSFRASPTRWPLANALHPTLALQTDGRGREEFGESARLRYQSS